jgi:predicted transcriptional regulator
MPPPRQPKDIPPPQELECLKALWILGEANVKSVQRELEPRKKLAYTTVMTLLERLAKKGAVSRRKIGRAFHYSAVLEKEALRRKAVQQLTQSLFEGSADVLLRYVQNEASSGQSSGDSPPDARLDASLL